jgi:lysophospholipase L1-like esterase
VRRTLQSLALAAVSVVVALGLAEAGFRLISTRGALSAEEIWSAQSQSPASQPEPIVIGGFHFSEEPIPESAHAEGVTRLLVLGDSFTIGWRLTDRGERFTDLVEETLDTELRSRGRGGLHVFNASVGGSNPLQWAGYLEALLPVFEPHAVVAVFFLRSGTPFATSLEVNSRYIEPIRQHYAAKPFYGTSALATFFWDRLAWRDYTDFFKRRVRASYVGLPQQRKMWLIQRHYLLQMANRCRKAGVPFHLVIFPLLFDLDDYEFLDVEAEIERFAAGHEIPVHSLTPGFLGKTDHELWIANNDQHPNAKGHRIAAETLLPYLRSSVLSCSTSRASGGRSGWPGPSASP